MRTASVFFLGMTIVFAGSATNAEGQGVSRIAARRDSVSMCPSLVVKLDRQLNASRIEISPIFLTKLSPVLALEVTAQAPSLGIRNIKTVSLSVLAVRDAGNVAPGHSRMAIIFDDSSALKTTWTYRTVPAGAGIAAEMIEAEISREEFGRLQAAKTIKVLVDADTLGLTESQTDVIRALSQTLNPSKAGSFDVPEGFMETGCNGPSPEILQAKWKAEACLENSPVGNEQQPSADTTADKPLASDIYLMNQVDVSAKISRGAAPIYPAAFKECRLEGTVLTRFVVLENGQVDVSTLQFLNSTHKLFSDAARDALAKMKFQAAVKSGVKVKQLVYLPFEFRMN